MTAAAPKTPAPSPTRRRTTTRPPASAPTTPSAPAPQRPAAARHSAPLVRSLVDTARHTMARRAHRLTINHWLDQLGLDTDDDLLAAIDNNTAGATALLVAQHQSGSRLATTLLLAAKARMLSAVSRHASGDSFDERFHTTVDAFLTRALIRAKPDHTYIDQQLYWITLRTVTNQRATHDDKIGRSEEFFSDGRGQTRPGQDVSADIDSYLSGAVILDWALDNGVITDFDRRALQIRYGGQQHPPVREIADQLGVGENRLETRLRRAMQRLRTAVLAHRDEIDAACIRARWSAQQTVIAGDGRQVA